MHKFLNIWVIIQFNGDKEAEVKYLSYVIMKANEKFSPKKSHARKIHPENLVGNAILKTRRQKIEKTFLFSLSSLSVTFLFQTFKWKFKTWLQPYFKVPANEDFSIWRATT